MTAPHPTDAAEPVSGTRRTLTRIAVVLVVLAITLFWFYILSGAPKRDSPDWLKDRSFADRTAATCASTRKAVNQLPPADTSKTADDRAVVVDEATAKLQTMVDTIKAHPSRYAKDRRIVTAWLGDWQVYLGNRLDYTKRLRKDPRAQFLVDAKPDVGDSYDAVIKNFADTNNIPDCAVTLDVG